MSNNNYRRNRSWKDSPQRGRFWKSVIFLVVLFVIGIFRPDWRDKIIETMNAGSATNQSPEVGQPLPPSSQPQSQSGFPNPVATQPVPTQPVPVQYPAPYPGEPTIQQQPGMVPGEQVLVNGQPAVVVPQAPLQEGTWTVVHFSDGDTFDVQNNLGLVYRIRLIGANTPETVKENCPVEPFGPEASSFTKGIILKHGGRVRIAFDGDRTDRFGRTLAMVYIPTPQGELWLNELLLREGFATAYLHFNYSAEAKRRFSNAQNLAKAERKNIWSLPPEQWPQ